MGSELSAGGIRRTPVWGANPASLQQGLISAPHKVPCALGMSLDGQPAPPGLVSRYSHHPAQG